MTSFLRRESVVLVIRHCVIALGGGVCAAVSGLILANAARPHLEPVKAVAAARPVIIDGPPTDVEAAPPPPARTPRLRRRPAEPFEDDEQDFETASGASPFEAAPRYEPQAPPEAPPEAPQAPMWPSRQAAQMQAVPPWNPCARLASAADQMVCAYPRLNAADEALRRLYGMALYRSDNPEALREEQQRWRAVRDQVAAEDGPQALAEVYAERIQELDGPY